jgi:hypothetical protein
MSDSAAKKTDALREVTEATIEKEIIKGVKSEVLEIYEEILTTVWDRMVPTLGVITVRTIMERAIFLTTDKHSFIDQLTITEKGLNFNQIQKYSQKENEDQKAYREAFKDFFANLFDILAKVTGNVLVQQLMKEVDGKMGGFK